MAETPPQDKPATLDHSRWLWIAAAAVVAVRLIFWAITRLTIEDSLISLRYAENLASGMGLIYNPGERVFGASTPLYVLFLAGLTKIGAPALFISKLLAALADGATMLLWGRWLLRETAQWTPVLFFALLFGLSPMVVPVSVSGMETSFALLLMTVSLVQATLPAEEERAAPPDWLRLGVPLGLLMIVRPDGAILAVVVLFLRWWRTRRLPLGAGLVAALIVLPWLVVATLYYGTPVPHSIPAKAAAYNLHRKTIWPNFWATVAEFAPTGGQWWRRIGALILLPCLLTGLYAAFRNPRLRPIGVLLLMWWAYLVLPKTLIFTWYFPLLLLPAYVLGAYGLGMLRAGECWPWKLPQRWTQVGVMLLTLLSIGSIGYGGVHWWKVQRAEERVRKAIGLWLAANTSADTRVAMEPIGYIGYFSRRRILDEVGLVSPEMVPLNRAGAGWFEKMLHEFKPPYIVERPGYLLRNRTLNSGVALFTSGDERSRFLAEYEPLITFEAGDVPNSQDYRFVIFQRRTAESAGHWSRVNAALSEEGRRELALRSYVGPVDLNSFTPATQ